MADPTVTDLRAQLAALGEPTTGNRFQLRARLARALEAAQVSAPFDQADPSGGALFPCAEAPADASGLFAGPAEASTAPPRHKATTNLFDGLAEAPEAPAQAAPLARPVTAPTSPPPLRSRGWDRSRLPSRRRRSAR